MEIISIKQESTRSPKPPLTTLIHTVFKINECQWSREATRKDDSLYLINGMLQSRWHPLYLLTWLLKTGWHSLYVPHRLTLINILNWMFQTRCHSLYLFNWMLWTTRRRLYLLNSMTQNRWHCIYEIECLELDAIMWMISTRCHSQNLLFKVNSLNSLCPPSHLGTWLCEGGGHGSEAAVSGKLVWNHKL